MHKRQSHEERCGIDVFQKYLIESIVIFATVYIYLYCATAFVLAVLMTIPKVLVDDQNLWYLLKLEWYKNIDTKN